MRARQSVASAGTSGGHRTSVETNPIVARRLRVPAADDADDVAVINAAALAAAANVTILRTLDSFLTAERGTISGDRAPVKLLLVLRRAAIRGCKQELPGKLQEGEEIAWPVPYWYADAGAAAMLIMLAAIDEGLAAGVFGVPAERMDRVRELLELPSDLAIVEVITIGFPAEDAASDRLSSRGTRPRRPLDEIVRWESWPRRS